MSSKETIEELLFRELRRLYMPHCLKFFEDRPEYDLRYLRIQTPAPGGDDEWLEVDPTDVFVTKKLDDQTPNAWVLSGPCGMGRSTMLRAITRSYLNKDGVFKGINDFQALFIFEGETLEHTDHWETIKEIIPEAITLWEASTVAEWLEDQHAVFLIDDFVTDTSEEDKVQAILEDYPNCSLLVVTGEDDAIKARDFLKKFRKTLFMRMPGISLNAAVSLFSSIHKNQKQIKHDLEKVIPLIGFDLEDLLRYPSIVVLLSNNWKDLFSKLNKYMTSTEILWNLINVAGFEGEDVSKWLNTVSRLCLECLQGQVSLLGEEVATAIAEAKSIFPLKWETLLMTLFNKQPALPPEKDVFYCIQSLPHQHMLAGWYTLWVTSKGTPLKRVLKKLENEDPVSFYVAGHLERAAAIGEMETKYVERTLRNLIAQSERSHDPMGFILRIIHELQSNENLTNTLLQDSVIPKYLEVKDRAVYAAPLKIIFECSAPEKVLVTACKGQVAPEIPAAISFLTRHKVKISLALMNQLEWGTKQSCDSIVKVFQNETNKAILNDCIGRLNCKTIASLVNWSSTKNIVCFRIRVTDPMSAEMLFTVSKEMPKLMWFEADFDFSFEEFCKCHIDKNDTALMDLVFRSLEDTDVKSLCEILSRIRKRYSGLHIHQSNLSPQGVMNILKEFFKRGIELSADPTIVNRYRRWRFPELECIPHEEKLTDEKVLHLLGYDDRKHYSDNEVRSSCIAKRLDVDALKHFFISLDNLCFFEYGCANYIVTKKTDGTAEVHEMP